MGPTIINGLPAHVFLVHIVVVFVPLASLLLLLSALWPAARRKLGVITPITALIALAAIPPTTNAGDWLIQRVDRSPELSEHEHLADGLLPWVIGLFAVSVLVWIVFEKSHWLRRDPAQAEPALVGATVGGDGESGAPRAPEPAPAATTPRRWLGAARIVLVVLAVVVSVGSVVDVALIGDAGAQAAWHDGFSMNPLPKTGSGH
ncbi:MAG TPA: hypothetical protein VGN81_02320 [Pseudonocardiaceae bacterium]|jgi:hypothetical protein